jgi:serine O-acetyltransferase
MYFLKRSQAKAAIEQDIHRWIQMHPRLQIGGTLFDKLILLLHAEDLEDFRNLLYYRIGAPANFLGRFLLAFSKKMFKPIVTLSISSPSVGPGLVTLHGVGTVIEAEKIGKNCLIVQDVVIGYKNEANDRPTIGDFVHVSTGAKILGNITIGDHAVIAANTVVTKDMPPNSLAIGVPARILKNAGNMAAYIARGEVPEP